MQELFVSVICVVNSSKSLNKISELHDTLEKNYSDFEIVIIDQSDNESVTQEVGTALKRFTSIRHIELSFKVKHDVAIAAGVENSIGDYIVHFNLDSDPIHAVEDLVSICMSKTDIVFGECKQLFSYKYDLIKPLINVLESVSKAKFPDYFTELFCINRKVANAVTETGRYHHKFFARIIRTGYKVSTYSYSTQSDKKRSSALELKNSFRELIFNSTRPLRWMSALGCLGGFLAFIFSVYSVLANIISGNVVQGWTTLVLFSSMLFMLLFVILAFFGEYLGRLLDDRSDKRDYCVKNEQHSTVMVNKNRINVTDSAE
ncbi:MAG: glycosyltransferase [Pseudomonadota bacterium]|uniref:glycosyltransferase n=1 Tax=Pseudoalteromonas spongiae TaxID=298657 RepID=UPI00026CD438|nr:glycosyltransferase [Pseudoalteromonas spongiae]ATC97652.1 hypothetical protein PSPO_a0437 [Pseudoalteromonas spongiae UST010723-006]MEC8325676.1 glycosyltransferase [Pseudomonadota bacterium]